MEEVSSFRGTAEKVQKEHKRNVKRKTEGAGGGDGEIFLVQYAERIGNFTGRITLNIRAQNVLMRVVRMRHESIGKQTSLMPLFTFSPL